jgi:hypothetical protein
VLEPFKHEVHLSNMSFYLTENSLHLHYKYKLANALYSENHAKPLNTLYGQNEEFLNAKAGGNTVTVDL